RAEFGVAAGGAKHVGERLAGTGVVGLDAERDAKLRFGAGEIAAGAGDERQVVAGDRRILVEDDGALVASAGARQAAELGEDGAHVDERARPVRREIEGALEREERGLAGAR